MSLLEFFYSLPNEMKIYTILEIMMIGAGLKLVIKQYNYPSEKHERENDKRCYSVDPIVRDYARKNSNRKNGKDDV